MGAATADVCVAAGAIRFDSIRFEGAPKKGASLWTTGLPVLDTKKGF